MCNDDALEDFFNRVWSVEEYNRNLEAAKARLNQLGCYDCSHRGETVTLCNSIIDNVETFPECPFCDGKCTND